MVLPLAVATSPAFRTSSSPRLLWLGSIFRVGLGSRTLLYLSVDLAETYRTEVRLGIGHSSSSSQIAVDNWRLHFSILCPGHWTSKSLEGFFAGQIRLAHSSFVFYGLPASASLLVIHSPHRNGQ